MMAIVSPHLSKLSAFLHSGWDRNKLVCIQPYPISLQWTKAKALVRLQLLPPQWISPLLNFPVVLRAWKEDIGENQ